MRVQQGRNEDRRIELEWRVAVCSECESRSAQRRVRSCRMAVVECPYICHNSDTIRAAHQVCSVNGLNTFAGSAYAHTSGFKKDIREAPPNCVAPRPQPPPTHTHAQHTTTHTLPQPTPKHGRLSPLARVLTPPRTDTCLCMIVLLPQLGVARHVVARVPRRRGP